MIQINLLDQTQGRGRSRRASGKPSGSLGGLVVVAAILGMAALNGFVAWTCYGNIDKAGEGERVARAKLKTIEAQIAKTYESSEQIRKFEQVVNNQKEVLKTLDPPDRLLWCEKINLLANLIPAKVFISEISLNEVVEMIETEASKAAHAKWEKGDKDKRGAEPEIIKRPIIHYDIAVTGLATGRDNVEQFDNVMAFHKAIIGYEWTDDLAKKHRFMDGFLNNIDFGAIEATSYEGVPVNKFVFKLRTINQGGKEEKSSRPATTIATASPSLTNHQAQVNDAMK